MTLERRRRTFLRLAGSTALVGFAGCTGDGGTGNEEASPAQADAGETSGNRTGAGDGTRTTTTSSDPNTDTTTETASETSDTEPTTTSAADLSGPVPAAYRTAMSQGGTERNPDSLQSKEAVEYQSQPKNDQQCSGCLFYIPDKNGDGIGACNVVEGYIQPKAWCASYSPYQDG